MRITLVRRRFARGFMTAICVSALVTACSSESSKPGGSDAASQATESAAAPKVVFEGTIDVSRRREVQARCVGAGSPTVLLEVGGSGNMTDWSPLFVDALGAKTTTCLYSRAGGEGSTPVDGLQTRTQIVSDAYTLLDTLKKDHGVTGPYVLVGWSFGGSVALAEALEHPETTAGLVILDTDFPSNFMPACRASGRSAKDCRATYKEDEEAKSIEKNIVARVHPLPNIPIAVVSAMQLPDCSVEPGAKTVTAEIGGTNVTAADCKALAAAIADKQRADWGRLGPQVTTLRVDGDHDHLIDEAPPEIVQLVQQMVTSAR
jgi:pimeloyl-ACP methyl ester carboxylesterase